MQCSLTDLSGLSVSHVLVALLGGIFTTPTVRQSSIIAFQDPYSKYQLYRSSWWQLFKAFILVSHHYTLLAWLPIRHIQVGHWSCSISWSAPADLGLFSRQDLGYFSHKDLGTLFPKGFWDNFPIRFLGNFSHQNSLVNSCEGLYSLQYLNSKAVWVWRFGISQSGRWCLLAFSQFWHKGNSDLILHLVVRTASYGGIQLWIFITNTYQ